MTRVCASFVDGKASGGEDACDFHLGGGGADNRDAGGVGRDGVVDEVVVGDVPQEVEIPGDASGFRAG